MDSPTPAAPAASPSPHRAPLTLNDVEARILGSLVEKSLTTPEQYPLSLNALVNSCNQKTSREPVMSLEESAVREGLATLLNKGLAERRHDPGSRVPKFLHNINALLEDGSPRLVGLVCVLLLRGPQTPGEIKTRTDRLCDFTSTAEIDSLLRDLASRGEGAIVSQLPRGPGQKETRWRHLFGEISRTSAATPAAIPAPAGVPQEGDRLTRLEKRVEALEALLKTRPRIQEGA